VGDLSVIKRATAAQLEAMCSMFRLLLVGACLIAPAAKHVPRSSIRWSKMLVRRAAGGAGGGGFLNNPATPNSTGAQRPFAQPRPWRRAD
jgi:hypothetical protein